MDTIRRAQELCPERSLQDILTDVGCHIPPITIGTNAQPSDSWQIASSSHIARRSRPHRPIYLLPLDQHPFLERCAIARKAFQKTATICRDDLLQLVNLQTRQVYQT